jgi:hypothetical protein
MEQVMRLIDWLTAGDIADMEVKREQRKEKEKAKRMVLAKDRDHRQALVRDTLPVHRGAHRQSQVRVK